jgi:hypothetical protein
MANENTKFGDQAIAKALDTFLRQNGLSAQDLSENGHLDDDTFSAFVEGNLSEKESAPIFTHLVSCRYCLHVTAALTKLMDVFEAQDSLATVTSDSPARVSDVLQGLMTRLFGSSEGAVFAHEEPKDEDVANQPSDDAPSN